MTTARTCLLLLLAAASAAAQEGAIEDRIRRQAEEIARLMRESERLLLELTHVDRIVETQRRIVEELEKLEPPAAPGGAAEEERARSRRELEQKQAEAARQLEEMFRAQKHSAERTVQQLEELLKSLPRRQAQGSGAERPEPRSAGEEREKHLRDRREERKQHQPRSQREERDEPKDPHVRGDRKPPSEDPKAERLKRIQAWIAQLPPEDLERINRNDFSAIPLRYRALVEEYTAQRARREAEKEAEENR